MTVLDDIANAIKRVADFFNWLIDNAKHLGEIIVNFWQNLENYLSNAISHAWDYIVHDIDSVVDWITSGLDKIEEAVREEIEPIAQSLYYLPEYLNDLISGIEHGFGDLLDNISKGLEDAGQLIQDVFTQLGQDISNAATGMIDYMFNNAVKLGDIVLEDIAHIMQDMMAELEVSAGGLPSSVDIATSMAGTQQYHQIIDMLKGAFGWFGEMLYKGIIGLLEYEPPSSPEKAMGAVGRYIDLMLTMNLLPMFIAKLPDVLDPIKNFNFDRIIQQLYWSLGLGWLSWIVFAEPFRVIIADPLQNYYLSIYKPLMPSKSLFDDLYKSKMISFEEYKNYLAKIGYREEWAKLYAKTIWNPPTDSTLKYALEAGKLGDMQLQEYANWKGYDDYGTQLYIEYLKNEALGKAKDLTMSQILKAYSLGLITREQAEEMLQSIGYSAKKASILLDLQDSEQQLQLTKLKTEIILEDLKDGYIDEQTAIQRLIEIGIDKAKAQLMVELTLAKKRKEIRQAPNKSDIKTFYEQGLIYDKQAIEWLIELGYKETIAEMIVQSWKLKQAEETKHLSKSEIVKAYSLGLINREQALEMLINLGYDKESAELILKIADYEDRQKIIELEIKEILEDLKDGYITENEAVERLTKIGVNPERAGLLVQLTLAKKRVELRQTPTLSQIEQFFKYGLVDEKTALEWLQLIGYKESLAEMFIKLWKLRFEPDQKEATRSLIVNAFKYGLIDYAQAVNMLKDIGYTEGVAKMILDIEVAKENTDIANEKAQNILLEYRYGLIDYDTARDELIKLGIAASRVDVLLEREKIRKERPHEPKRITASYILRALKYGLINIKEADEWLEEIGYTDPKDRALMIVLYIIGTPQEQQLVEELK